MRNQSSAWAWRSRAASRFARPPISAHQASSFSTALLLFDPGFHCLETVLRQPVDRAAYPAAAGGGSDADRRASRLLVRPEPPRGIETRCHFRQAAAVAMKPQQILVHRDETAGGRGSADTMPKPDRRSLLLPTPPQASEQQCVVSVLLLSGFQKRDGGSNHPARVDRSEIHASVEREVSIDRSSTRGVDGCITEMELCQGQKDLHAGFAGVASRQASRSATNSRGARPGGEVGCSASMVVSGHARPCEVEMTTGMCSKEGMLEWPSSPWRLSGNDTSKGVESAAEGSCNANDCQAASPTGTGFASDASPPSLPLPAS